MPVGGPGDKLPAEAGTHYLAWPHDLRNLERTMSLPLEQLETAALDLPVRERAALAHRLIASLDEGPDEDPTEVELAWEEEIRRRLASHRAGEAEPVSSADVFARARALLK